MSEFNNKHISLMMLFLLPVFAAANTDLPDPTRPADFIAENTEPVFIEEIDTTEKINWKVTAIRISEKDRSAIVNGKLVRAGDDVGPAKILEINPLSVVIDYEKRKLILRLFNNQVVKNYKITR